MQVWDQVKVIGKGHEGEGRAGKVIEVSKGGDVAVVRLDAQAREGGGELPEKDVSVTDADIVFLGR